jgi:nucleoid DNA-binding protein
MDKYIKQLLEEFSKIILPGFGAIVLEDEETGELMFNEYLTYNDGKLDAKIAEESNLEPQEVKNTIAKYVRDIQTQIDKGETYDIFGLGFFTKNKDGEVEFNGNLKTGPIKNTAFEGPSPTPLSTQEKSQESPASTVDKKENQFTASNDRQTVNHNQYNPPIDKEEDNVKATTKNTIAVSNTNETSTASKENTIERKEERKKKRRSPLFWIIIILLVVCASGVVFITLNYQRVETYMGWNQFEEAVEKKQTSEIGEPFINDSSSRKTNANEETSDETKIDTLPNSKTLKNISEEALEPDEETINTEVEENHSNGSVEVEENKIVEQQKKAIKTGSYHLIAGSFSVYENAEQLVTELKEKGLDAKIIGKIGALHFVSAQSYDSLEQAQKDLSNVRFKAPGAWIYKY